MTTDATRPARASAIGVIKRENLRTTVTNALRAAVISGEMEPDVLYSAPTLSQQFGVSATPVREAMLDLMSEGLVTSVPNKGYMVLPVSDRDLDEITDIRLMTEPRATVAAARRLPGDIMPELRERAEKIVTAAQSSDLIGYVDADREFHLRILEFYGNTRLLKLVSDLRAQTRLYGLKSLVEHGALVDSARQHHALLDLIEAQDFDALDPALRAHIGMTRGIWAKGVDD
ncbi:MAG TPA: GntR family transcriptional regulator [Gordonia polyisoprenivorans]|nr:GntR family transcriptional regulator [Gordonia polyisoprenivorans]